MRRSLWSGLLGIGASGCSLLFDVSASDYVGHGDASPDVDAALVGDAPGSSPCHSSTIHTFCADFEDAVATGWSGQSLTADGAIRTVPSSSGGHMLEASCGAPHTNECSARLYYLLPLVPTHVRIDFDLQVCTATQSGHFEFVKLEFPTAAETDSVGFVADDLVLGLDAHAFTVSTYSAITKAGDAPPLSGPSTEKLVHFTFDLTTTGQTGHLEVYVDGAASPVIAKDVPSPGYQATGARLLVGTYANTTDFACTNHVDNVVLDAN